MPDALSPESPPVDVTASPCRHLRSNGMYIFTDGQSAAHGGHDNSSSSFWCLKTMKGFGPDDDMVNGEECRNPARTCCEVS
jgi:hypothetical protein